MRKLFAITTLFLNVYMAQTASASLVQVDITGHVEWYLEGNYFGVDSSTPVSGYIIYDDSITQTDGEYNFAHYDDWEFSLVVGDTAANKTDARINQFGGEPESSIWFEGGMPTWFWFQTIEGYEPSVPRSRMMVTDDYWDDYPGYDYYFELVHEYNQEVAPALWLAADGVLTFSVPHSVTAVPLPASLYLFLSGLSFLAPSLVAKMRFRSEHKC